jgi:D-serine deaminase-like pyridoxal phosphate-dependent protein
VTAVDPVTVPVAPAIPAGLDTPCLVVVLDAGAKTLTKDRAAFLEGFGVMPAYPDAVIERLFDYHAAVVMPAGLPGPRLGEIVAIVPNHVCPVAQHFDGFVVAREGRLEDRWPVDARGRSR